MLSPSPPLAWTGIPAGTSELALTMTTIALDGTKYNWVLFHIPANVTSLSAAATVGTAGVFTVLDGRDDHPIVGVRWEGAVAYAN